MTTLVHIARHADWEAAQAAGEYTNATFRSAGVIFCCRPSQLELVARLHFGERGDLLLLHVESEEIPAEIDWVEYECVEKSFPHVHGPLPLAAVRRIEDFSA